MKFLVIPAYEPDEKLINLLKEVNALAVFQTIVVNDGSKTSYDKIFNEAKDYAIVISHKENRGKGAALKTAFSYIASLGSGGIIITADADGQHKVNDILKVCAKAEASEGTLVTGVRCFSGKIPLRSRLGNLLTKYIYLLVSGQFLTDTQCGLRAFHTSLLPFMLSVKGERYEYEMNMLLSAKKNRVKITEVPIETVYLDGNSSSHFHPLRDAVRIYGEIFKFALSSISSFIADYTGYLLLSFILSPLPTGVMLMLSNIGARAVSSLFNFTVNKKYVFKHKGNLKRAMIRYFALAGSILAANTLILLSLYALTGGKPYILKLLTEAVCFIVSFIVQKRFIFKNNTNQIKEEIKPCIIKNC